MATKQGMCKNCGSLVMFDDRDELCECVFCNCVFPSAEAAKIGNAGRSREGSSEG